MYCPRCKAEFREGFTQCSDCDVPLVAGVPAPDPPPADVPDPALLLRTSDVPYLMLVKSLLRSADIGFIVQGEEALGMLTVLPSGLGGPRNADAQVFVRGDDIEAARTLLEASPPSSGTTEPQAE